MNNGSPTKNIKKILDGDESTSAYVDQLRFLGNGRKNKDRGVIPAPTERSPKIKAHKRLSPTHVKADGEYDSLPSENSIGSEVRTGPK